MAHVQRDNFRRRARSRIRPTAATAGLLLTLSTLSTVSALPATTASAESIPIPARGSAYMGMGVLAHDGTGPRRAAAHETRAARTEGVDVSSYQQDASWPTLWSNGVKWAYVKATEGTSYRNPYFGEQYDGGYAVGMVRGAYHFATPDTSSGTAQADYFVDNGGGWSGDGRTLPGALDIEWNPYCDSCYGKSKSGMVSWIRDFVNRYKARTGRAAVIYTATSWWSTCTGDSSAFGSTNPLWVASYASSAGPLPAGWSSYTMWQYTSSGQTVGDHDRFNGPVADLRDFASG